MSEGPRLPDGLPEPTWKDEAFGIALYRGDCLEILPTLPDGCIDAVVTDPPYGIPVGSALCRKGGKEIDTMAGGFNSARNDAWIGLCASKLTAGGNLAFFHSRGDEPKCDTVVPWHRFYWYKPSAPMTPRPVFVSSVEECTIAQVEGNRRWFGNGWVQNYWSGLSPNRLRTDHGHPSEKPLELIKILCSCLSGNSDCVIDPYMGSGTTGVACVRLGRAFIGIELEPKYFDIAVSRIRNEIINYQGGPMFAKHEPATLFTEQADGDA